MSYPTQRIIRLLKKLPVDIGQAEMKHRSAGKKIACSFIPKVKHSHKKTALDIGCRDGYWSDWLKKRGYKVTSIDIEPLYKGAIICDVEDGLPFKKSSFDIVFCTEVIEHLHKPSLLISEIDRVLKKGGRSVLTTPNSNWFFYWFTRLFGYTPDKLQNRDHKQFFSYKTLQSISPGYKIFGYFPYILFFKKISKLVDPLSPTFIFTKRN